MLSKQPLAQPANIVFLYDGSFDGFLCCVYYSVYTHQIPVEIAHIEEAQPSFFKMRTIKTELEKAQKVKKSIPLKISIQALEIVQTVFLSDLEQKETYLLKFLLLGYQVGGKVVKMLGHPDVAPVLKAERNLRGEVHLFLGFVRFVEHGEVLIAEISPKNFVLPFMVEHFCSRYSQENFLIYDKTHNAALLYDKSQAKIIPLEDLVKPPQSEKEEEFQKMWKQFYHTVAIEARYNPKCRMAHLPKRYWKNMTELAELL